MRGKHGLLFGNNFNAYGVKKMPINVYDTPGFFDSDECQNDNNKKKIASQIGDKIDVFAYFMDSNNARMDTNIQKIFERLNDWTMGNIWNNLVIVYSRFTRSSADQLQNSFIEKSKPKDLARTFEEFKSFLQKKAVENKWNRTIIDNEGIESSRLIQESDFDNVRYSLGFHHKIKFFNKEQSTL